MSAKSYLNLVIGFLVILVLGLCGFFLKQNWTAYNTAQIAARRTETVTTLATANSLLLQEMVAANAMWAQPYKASSEQTEALQRLRAGFATAMQALLSREAALRDTIGEPKFAELKSNLATLNEFRKVIDQQIGAAAMLRDAKIGQTWRPVFSALSRDIAVLTDELTTT